MWQLSSNQPFVPAYKLIAALLKARLIQAGVEHQLTKTQFGYKSGTGTTDAIFVLRRRIETAIAQRGGKLIVLALDWQKAFDSIAPSALITGLRRFGISEGTLDVIADIYSSKRFRVRDRGHESQVHQQMAG